MKIEGDKQMRPTALSGEEIAARGNKIYNEKIRSKVEGSHYGDFVIIDIDSGDFELDPQDIEASVRLKNRRPCAVMFGLRVGFSAAYRFGFRSLRSES